MKLKNYTGILLFLSITATSLSSNAQYIATIAGTGGISGYAGDGGAAVGAKLNGCTGVAVDGAGNVYIADRGNNVVRRINLAGVISTFAGTGTAGHGGNGGQAALAQLDNPSAVVGDGAGNIYIADFGNNTVRVVNAMGVIRDFAGNGFAGYAGDGDTAHYGMLNGPQGLALDGSGNLYIADGGNNAVRMVSADYHLMSTVAGNTLQGYSGDGGPATAAKLFAPSDVAADYLGNVYIADQFNNAVRKIAPTGTISTFAGTGLGGNSGDGGPAAAARLKYPASVTVDGSANVYIADQGNNNIRMVNTAGVISHIAGESTFGYDGDGGLAVNAKLGAPKGVRADGWGRLYIADYNNHVVRVISASAGLQDGTNGARLVISPNPTTGSFNLELPSFTGTGSVSITDMLGRVVYTGEKTAADISMGLNVAHLTAGNYLVKVTTAAGNYTGKLTLMK